MSRRISHYDVFAAIADPTRRAILERLGEGEKPVLEVAGLFPITLSAISQHMRVLREAGLVTVRKVGRERIYALDPGPLKEVADWVRFYEQFWDNRLEALGDYLEETTK